MEQKMKITFFSILKLIIDNFVFSEKDSMMLAPTLRLNA